MSGRCPCCGHGLTRRCREGVWEVDGDPLSLVLNYLRKTEWVVYCDNCGLTVSCDMRYKDIIDSITGRDI